MSQNQKSYRLNVMGAALQLVAGLLGALVIYVSTIRPLDSPTSAIVAPIFWMFFSLFVIEKVGLVHSAYLEDRTEAKLDNFYEVFPGLLDNGLRTLTSRAEGFAYITYRVRFAKRVKNTVLRYGNEVTAQPGEHYKRWIDAKVDAIIHNDCKWTEIVSKHLTHDDLQSEFMSKVKDTRKSGSYVFKYIDDAENLMMQVIIFEFEGAHKEAVFGWEYPGREHGPSFVSQNPDVIAFLECYFDQHFKDKPKRTAPRS